MEEYQAQNTHDFEKVKEIYIRASQSLKELEDSSSYSTLDKIRQSAMKKKLFTDFRKEIEDLDPEIYFQDASYLDNKYFGLTDNTLWACPFDYPIIDDRVRIGCPDPENLPEGTTLDDFPECTILDFGLLTMSYEDDWDTCDEFSTVDMEEVEEIYKRASKAYFGRRKFENEQEVLEPFHQELEDFQKNLSYRDRIMFDQAAKLDEKHFGINQCDLSHWQKAFDYPSVGNTITSGPHTMRVINHGLLTMRVEIVDESLIKSSSVDDQDDDEDDEDIFDDYVIIEKE
jgi:hypothetical protein